MTKYRTPHHRPLPFFARNPFVYWLLLAALALLTGIGLHQWLSAQSNPQVQAAPLPLSAGQNADEVWEPLTEHDRLAQPANVTPGRQFRALRLNRLALQDVLRKAPRENTASLRQSQSILSLPLPDGSLQRFYIEESPTMEPALAAKFPEIKSYRGQGVDDPAAVTRFDWSPRGLYALVLTNQDSFSIAPLQSNDLTTYVSYSGQDAVSPRDYECLTQQLPETQESIVQADKPRAFSFGTERRNFRIAIATTVEYTNNANLGGGTPAKALASVNTWLNAVNLIYERDLAMHFNLVANNDQVIFSSTDSFTDGNASAMLDEVRGVLSQTLGASAYDVGHVLGTGGSGVAYVGVGCYDSGSPGPYKGGGVSLISPSATLGNTFYITRIAHELGHQFGAYHSFNDSDPAYSCAPSRTATTAWESGSGLTVMSYAGSCNPITVTRGMHFHGGSIGQIDSYVAYNGTCVSSSVMSNNPPVVSPGNDYTIPRNTPFALTASASDPDSGDTANLSYSWEEKDAGGANYGNPPFTDASDAAGSTRPIFRPYAPVSSPTRYFPSLTYILNNANVPPATTVDSGYVVNTGESLPNVTRVMNFKLTVRDQRGGVSDDDVLISVESGAGPFAVTAPNTNVSWTGGSQQTVTWSVNNTNAAPVNCTQVRLLLSTDGGNTFPIILLSATPNDGSETITVPSGYTSSTARLKVEAVNNIFFDISNTNFTLAAGSTACPTISGLNPTSGQTGTTVTLTGNNFTGVSAVKFPNNVSASFAVASNTQLTATVPAGAVSGPITVSKSGCSDVQSASFSLVSCSYTLNTTTFNAAATASTSSVNVTAGTGCAWTATSNASWLTITGGASGSGNGSVNFSIAANTGPARNGTLTIAGQTVTVNQAAGCSYSLSATSQNVAATASNGSVNVTAGTGCTWTAVSNANWLSVTAGASGTGNGTVSYSAAANTGAARSGTLTIAGQTFTVNQAGGCTTSLSATSYNASAAAGSSSVNLTAGTGCTWTAASNANWLTITAGASGSGNGAVNFSIAANTGAARSGSLTIAGQTFTVNQAAGCTFALSATSQSVAADAGNGTVNVTAGTGCTWTAVSNANWLIVVSGASGSGNGTVSFSYSANSGAARSGTFTIAGQTFTVNQAAGCSFALSATSQNVTGTGGTGTLTVTAGSGCAWTATSNAAWLTITSGATGNGTGTVGFTAAANTGAARSGTLTVAGQTVTINQAANCSYSLASTSASFSATASAGAVNVQSGAGCAWTATSNASWLTITAGSSGSGTGSVNFNVAANTGPARSGTLTVAGQTFTVNQAAGCSFALSSASQDFTTAGGSATVNVTTASGCAWTAASNANWLTVTGGASGSGNGTVTFTAAANSGPSRTGTLTIAGLTFTVSQSSGCAVQLSATTVSLGAAASTGSLNVTGAAGCAWTATSNANWLTITAGASGSGNGTVSYNVAANTGAARTGLLSIGGITVTVNQAAATCSYSVSPTAQTFDAQGGSKTFNVTTASHCGWTAASNAPWLTLSGSLSFTGSATVTVSAPAYSGPQRSGTLTLAGQTVTVTQTSGCRFVLNKNADVVAAAGATLSATVTSEAGCAWTAASNVNWVTITSGGSGNGNGTVQYTVAPNTGAQSRSGQLTIGGQPILIQQAGVDTTPITISDVSPMNVQAGSGQFTLTVNGANFASGSVVRWNGSSRTTTFVSATQLKATIPATDVAAAGKASVTVFDGARNLTSNAVDFVIAGAAANLSAASYDTSAFAPEQIVALFGQKLALSTATATSLPLPTTLGGTRVIIKDSAGVERLAPLFFVWASQINYQIPAGLAAGPAQVTVMTDDGNMSMGNIQIIPVAPGLFSANSNGAGWASGVALRIVNGNQQRYEAITTYDPVTKKYVAVPIELGPVPGQLYLVLYGTGLRQRSSLNNVSCTIGGVPATINYAGKQGGMVGVDQLNIMVPSGLAGRGAVDILVTIDGKQANVVKVQMQ